MNTRRHALVTTVLSLKRKGRVQGSGRDLSASASKNEGSSARVVLDERQGLGEVSQDSEKRKGLVEGSSKGPEKQKGLVEGSSQELEG